MENFNDIYSMISSRNNPIILDKNNQFIFFPNNKVAQTSISRRALEDRTIIKKDDEILWKAHIKKIDKKYFTKVFTFTIVRNPYDRAVSAFAYLQSKGEIEPDYDFPSFCRHVLQIQGRSFNPHFDLQSDGLFYHDRIIPKFVGRFEHLSRDWRKIAKAIGAPKQLPHVNKSARKPNYQIYYDDYSRKVVTELFAIDIENFNYEFEHRKRFFFWLK